MKRFVETDRWIKDKWFSELKPEHKLFWTYLTDHCDNVGVWEVNLRIASLLIGYEYSMDTLLIAFKNKVHVFDDGEKWWIPSFITFQHGVLDPDSTSKPIQSYIALLRKHTLWIPYTKGIHTLQGKGKGKGKGKGREETCAKYPEDFEKWWAIYRKGSKANAFKRWKEKKKTDELPSIDELIEYTASYKLHCESTDRPMKDGEGWINGKYWESDWSSTVTESRPARRGL